MGGGLKGEVQNRTKVNSCTTERERETWFLHQQLSKALDPKG